MRSDGTVTRQNTCASVAPRSRAAISKPRLIAVELDIEDGEGQRQIQHHMPDHDQGKRISEDRPTMPPSGPAPTTRYDTVKRHQDQRLDPACAPARVWRARPQPASIASADAKSRQEIAWPRHGVPVVAR